MGIIDLDVSAMYPHMIDYSGTIRIKDEYRMRVLNRKYWPYHVAIDREKDWGKAERWCYENFSSGGWRNVGSYFAFKNGSEATAFSLKWL
jgi:hypothetical protein